MRFEGAVIKEQGVTFAIVVVKKRVVDNRNEADRVIRSFAPVFPGLPVVLVAQDSQGRATYYGREDIANFMANVPLSAVRWKEYTVN